MPKPPEPQVYPAVLNALHCHPSQPASAVSTVAASARFNAAGELLIDYRIHGDPAALRIPAPATPGPADGLWQNTCLEAFVAPAQGHFLGAAEDGAEYHEFNFSPAGHWASYRFTGYRARDTAFRPAAAPHIHYARCSDGFLLRATLTPEMLPAGTTLELGLTAVIVTADGSKSYWALAHCAAQPDFHLRQSFALTLQRNIP